MFESIALLTIDFFIFLTHWNFQAPFTREESCQNQFLQHSLTTVWRTRENTSPTFPPTLITKRMSMKTKTILFIGILGTAIALGFILLFPKSKTPSPPQAISSQQQKKEEDIFDPPFSYLIHQGWTIEKFSNLINTIPGGGPKKSLVIIGPHSEKDVEGLFDPIISLSWFHFNPQAPLEDVVPLLYAPGTEIPPFQKSELGGKQSVSIMTLGDQQKIIDGDGVSYRVDVYLVRLDDGSLFTAEILYGTQRSYENYRDDVSTILSSLI